jgi:peroxiredoxin
MKKFILFLISCCVFVATAKAGTLDLANGVRKEYDSNMELWTLKVKAATTPEIQSQIWKDRPDAKSYAKRMWKCLEPSLAEDWTLEPAGWLLELIFSLPTPANDQELPAFRKEVSDAIRKSVTTSHMKSEKLAPLCLGLLATNDNQSLKLLESIEKENPDPKVQGVAALATAIQLQNFGDEAKNMKRRLMLIRKAIVQSADVMIGEVSVAKLAEDQLYRISYLSKGREAPDLSGVDVTGSNFKLSYFTGKIIVLFFWNSDMPDAPTVINIQREFASKIKEKPVVLIGVNNDNSSNMRQMHTSGQITWRNFSDTKNELSQSYRVNHFPVVFVLDHERKIQYVGNPGSFVDLTVDALIPEIK